MPPEYRADIYRRFLARLLSDATLELHVTPTFYAHARPPGTMFYFANIIDFQISVGL